jgi:hypothetical protein
MTTRLYNAPGQIQTLFRVHSIHNCRQYVTAQTGTNSSSNVRRSIEDEKFIENARLNAIYKHLEKIKIDTANTNSGMIENVYGVQTTLMSYDIKYYNTATIKRRKYRKGDYYDVVTDNRSGKVLGATKRKYEWNM